jgi:D-amino-acid oxidase
MMSLQPQRFGVVGGGVIGLSTAILALRRGHAVTLYSDTLPLETTSAKAAASFKPHEVASNDLTHTMLTRAWSHFDQLAGHPGAPCGVRRHTHWEASSSQLLPQAYLSIMPDLKTAQFPDVPGGYRYGRSYTTFFIDIPLYLPWLYGELKRLGGQLVHLPRRYEDLEELARLPHDVVFNCTGLGARQLCKDDKVYAIRGQIAIIGPQPDMDWSISADGFYVYPRSTDTVIGGTAEPHNYSETNDHIALSLLLRANRRIIKDLDDSMLIRSASGLRPYREDSVRIEPEAVGGRRIIHQYGHGGAGITLSWGSAEVALDLASGSGTQP